MSTWIFTKIFGLYSLGLDCTVWEWLYSLGSVFRSLVEEFPANIKIPRQDVVLNPAHAPNRPRAFSEAPARNGSNPASKNQKMREILKIPDHPKLYRMGPICTTSGVFNVAATETPGRCMPQHSTRVDVCTPSIMISLDLLVSARCSDSHALFAFATISNLYKSVQNGYFVQFRIDFIAWEKT